MSKWSLLISAAVLVGCASTDNWRTLRIDGSSEESFQDSLTVMAQALPQMRSQMLQIALVDIARSSVGEAGEEQDGNTEQIAAEFRRELDGLTYENVIAMADETGPSVWRQYSAGNRGRASGPSFYSFPDQAQPSFTIDGQPVSDYRPGGLNWPTGADARGRAEYPSR